MKINIVDTDAGNLRSLENFFRRNFTNDIFITKYANSNFSEMDILVIPGVGNFGYSGKIIYEYDNGKKIKDFHKTGKKLIGICLGAQLLTQGSEESPGIKGLGLIKGKCKSLANHPNYQGRVPRVGWSKLSSEEYEKYSFYFVHSYYIDPEEEEKQFCKIESCVDGVTASIEKDNLLAMQFHPEKSNGSGLKIVKDFIK